MDNNLVKDIYDYGIKNDVPIIKDEGLDKLLEVINFTKPKKILEIGTAIAYSSIVMALNSEAIIDTIERNKKMYDIAIENVRKYNLSSRIRIHNSDALLIDEKELEKDYDLIFIDGAKAQYRRFFLKFQELLKTGGVIFTDNLSFHGMVEKYRNNTLTDVSKDLRALVRKINDYNIWLKEYQEFDTTFYNIGDGIAISIKK